MTNRPIKFRYWDKDSKFMSEWPGTGVLNDNFLHAILNDKNFSIMQFTGLLDKNGREIYEGDILSAQKRNKVSKDEAHTKVFWMETHAMFQHTWNEGNPFHPWKEFWNNEPLWNVACSMSQSICEIIGNIYENPELLSKKL